MKKVCVTLLCVLLTCFFACDTSTDAPSPAITSPNEDALYSDIIKGLIGKKNIFYALYDLDQNGTKELLLGIEIWGNIICPYLVFSIHNGVAVEQKTYLWFEGNGPAPVVFKTGTLRVEISDDAGSRFYYYKMDKGALVLWGNLIVDISVYDWDNQTYHDAYFLLKPDADERISIAQEEFERLQKELEGDGAAAALDWKVPSNA